MAEKLKELVESITKQLENEGLKKAVAELTRELSPFRAALINIHVTRLLEKVPALKDRIEELKTVIGSVSEERTEDLFSVLEENAASVDAVLEKVGKIKKISLASPFASPWLKGVWDYSGHEIDELVGFVVDTKSTDMDAYSRLRFTSPSLRKSIIDKIKQFAAKGVGENFIRNFINFCKFTYRKEELGAFDPLIDRLGDKKALESLEAKDVGALKEAFDVASNAGLQKEFLAAFENFGKQNVSGIWLELVKDMIGEYSRGAERPIHEALKELLDENALYKVFLPEAARELYLDSYLLSGFSAIKFKPSEVPKMDANNKVVYLPGSIGDFKFFKGKGKTLRLNPNYTLYAGFAFHEISHLRYGSYVGIDLTEYFKKFDNPLLAKKIINTIEDFRVNDAFYKEFDSKRPLITKALRNTDKYSFSNMGFSDNALQNFIREFMSLLIGGKPLSHFNPEVRAEEEKLLKTEVEDEELRKAGINSYGEALDYIAGISKGARGKTVIHSAERTAEVYDIVKKIFKEKAGGKAGEELEKEIGKQMPASNDLDLSGNASQELTAQLGRKDANKFLEDLKESAENKELKEAVEKALKKSRKETKENIEKEVSDKIETGYGGREQRKKMKGLQKKLAEKAQEGYEQGKSMEQIEQEIENEFNGEVDKSDMPKWQKEELKKNFSKKTLEAGYQRFSEEKLGDVEKEILTQLDETKDEKERGEAKKEEAEKMEKLKSQQSGKLAPKSLDELKKMESEAERRANLQRVSIEKATEKLRRSEEESEEQERERKERKGKESYFLGYDPQSDSYSLHQSATIFPYSRENSGYWEGMDRSAVVKTKNILGRLLKGKEKTIRGLKEGEIDVEALINAQMKLMSGNIDENAIQRIFKRSQKAERNYATGILIDISGSTSSGAGTGEKKVIDVEKEAAYVLGEATSMLQDKLAIYGFDGVEDGKARMHEVKRFEDGWTGNTKAKLGALSPAGNTPLSIAIRAIASETEKRKERNKMLFVITDGEPNCGSSIEDTRKAMQEARKRGIYVVYVNIDAGGGREYYSKLADSASYAVLLPSVAELPGQLFDIYMKKRKI
jgi:nitric oxide reductase activation protein